MDISPLTFGQEIEQSILTMKDGIRMTMSAIEDYFMEKRNGDYDSVLSRIYEWHYGPYTDPSDLLSMLCYEYIRPSFGGGEPSCLYPDSIWVWENFSSFRHYEDITGHGSHIHISPNSEFLEKIGIETNIHNEKYVSIWRILWNSLIYLLPLLSPLIYMTPAPRPDNDVWASYTLDLKGTHFRRPVFFEEDEYYSLGEIDNKTAHDFLSKWHEREYLFLSVNSESDTGKPLTYEIRACESHPIFLATLQEIIKDMMGLHFVYHSEVKVTEKTKDNISKMMINIQDSGAMYHMENKTHETIYNIMENSGSIEFIELLPIFEDYDYDCLYSKDGLYFNSALSFFNEICRYYILNNNEDEHITRSLWFLFNKGYARANILDAHLEEPWENFWHAYGKKEFQWKTVPPLDKHAIHSLR